MSAPAAVGRPLPRAGAAPRPCSDPGAGQNFSFEPEHVCARAQGRSDEADRPLPAVRRQPASCGKDGNSPEPLAQSSLLLIGLSPEGNPSARRRPCPRSSSSWMSDRLTSCGTSCQTTTREGAQARSRYGCARRPATAAAARRGLALDQLDAHASPAGGRGREARRVDGRRIIGPITITRNAACPSYLPTSSSLD